MADWITIVIRSLGAIAMLFIITRILGKKQISQLTFFEYITGITLGELAGFISTDIENNYFLGALALFVWFLVPFLLEMTTLKSKKLREWFDGKGTVLIKEGKILEDNLKKERYTADELLEQLRTKNVFKVQDVEFAVLEASGDVSVMLKRENQPLTPKDMMIKPYPEKEPQAVIIDGKVVKEAMANSGYSIEWLMTELEKIGVPLNNVFLGQVDSNGSLYVDLYDDLLQVPVPQEKEVLLATLKKCQADLEMFSLSTQNRSAKYSYQGSAARIKKVLKQLRPAIKRM